MEQLYDSLVKGRLDVRLPLANGRAPKSASSLRQLVAMPKEQHMRLQVSTYLQTCACILQSQDRLHVQIPVSTLHWVGATCLELVELDVVHAC